MFKNFFKAYSGLTLGLIFIFLCNHTAFSQELADGLKATGTVSDANGKKLSGVTVMLYDNQNSSEIGQAKTKPTGLFTCNLELGKEYLIVFSKKDYLDKKILVNTSVDSSQVKHFVYRYSIVLPNDSSKNEDALDKPGAKISFNSGKRKFDIDSLYTINLQKEKAALKAEKERKKQAEIKKAQELAEQKAKEEEDKKQAELKKIREIAEQKAKKELEDAAIAENNAKKQRETENKIKNKSKTSKTGKTENDSTSVASSSKQNPKVKKAKQKEKEAEEKNAGTNTLSSSKQNSKEKKGKQKDKGSEGENTASNAFSSSKQNSKGKAKPELWESRTRASEKGYYDVSAYRRTTAQPANSQLIEIPHKPVDELSKKRLEEMNIQMRNEYYRQQTAEERYDEIEKMYVAKGMSPKMFLIEEKTKNEILSRRAVIAERAHQRRELHRKTTIKMANLLAKYQTGNPVTSFYDVVDVYDKKVKKSKPVK